MIHNIILASQLRYRFQYCCPMPVMARIPPNEQHIDRPILANCILRHFRVVRGKEILRTASVLIQLRKNRRKIVDDEVIIGKRRVSERHGMPGDDIFYATRETPDEVRSPTRRVEIVKHIRAVLFNLRFQDITQRRTCTHSVLSRPNSLNIPVITIGKKRPFGSLINGQKDMSCRLSKIQKRVNLTSKRKTVFGQLANPRTQRRIVSGVLEEPHNLGVPTGVIRVGILDSGVSGASNSLLNHNSSKYLRCLNLSVAYFAPEFYGTRAAQRAI